jgi:hypothetical protein
MSNNRFNRAQPGGSAYARSTPAGRDRHRLARFTRAGRAQGAVPGRQVHARRQAMKMHAMKATPTAPLDPREAAQLLRQAIEHDQDQQPALAVATPVRVGGQWLRRYEPGELAIDTAP